MNTSTAASRQRYVQKKLLKVLKNNNPYYLNQQPCKSFISTYSKAQLLSKHNSPILNFSFADSNYTFEKNIPCKNYFHCLWLAAFGWRLLLNTGNNKSIISLTSR
jgi:hypothetical protein